MVSEVRPDLHVNIEDERELVLVRSRKELNATMSFNMVTEAPHVRVEYDKKKRYAPKYEVTFYMERPVVYQLAATFVPLMFVVYLAAMNVLNGNIDGPDLGNSISICLTIVFVLPNLRSACQRNRSKDPDVRTHAVLPCEPPFLSCRIGGTRRLVC